MIEQIFASLADSFKDEVVVKPTSYYFSLGGIKKTVLLSEDGCRVEDGRTVETADCVCKTSEEFFMSIWNEGYRPGMADFLSGKIKTNDPTALQLFLRAFGKE
jgi:putative sterol carrier protein